MARSVPRRRVTRPKAAPTRLPGIGKSTDATISPRLRLVRPGPTRKSSSSTVLSPEALMSLTPAPYTSRGGTVSAAGEALQMLPARVARLRICTDPTTTAASARARKCRCTRPSSTMSVMTVEALIERYPSSTRIAGRSSAICLRSMTNRGLIDPSRNRIRRSVPPANSRASGPYSSSNATASLTVRGRAYSNPFMGDAQPSSPCSRSACSHHSTLSTSSISTWGVAARTK